MSPQSSNLDLLRATAVSMVLASHIIEQIGTRTEASIRMGRAGVMIFFVHTSFVLMQSLARLESTSGKRVALRFYLRRAFRVYPLAWVVLAFVLWVIRPNGPPATTVAANLLLCQNILGVGSIVTVMWSLAPEVQMYAILPFFRRYQRSTVNDLLILFGAWILLVSFLPGRLAECLRYVPCFLPGIMAYQISRTSKPVLPSWSFPLALASFLALYVRFGTRMASIPPILCLCVGLSLPWFREIRVAPLKRGSYTVAKYSYGIYLVHLLCISGSFVLLIHYPMWVRVVAFSLELIASCWLLHQTIERPFINLGVRLADAMSQPRDA